MAPQTLDYGYLLRESRVRHYERLHDVHTLRLGLDHIYRQGNFYLVRRKVPTHMHRIEQTVVYRPSSLHRFCPGDYKRELEGVESIAVEVGRSTSRVFRLYLELRSKKEYKMQVGHCLVQPGRKFYISLVPKRKRYRWQGLNGSR